MLMAAASGLVLVLLTWLITRSPLLCLVALPIGLLGLPKLALNFLIKRRRQKFTTYFADAIDVIVRGVRSGLTVGECLNIVAREMPAPVGPEFSLVNEGIKLGMTMAEVLQRMSDRLPTPEVRFFTIVLITQQTTGGNLAETLAKLSDVLRSAQTHARQGHGHVERGEGIRRHHRILAVYPERRPVRAAAENHQPSVHDQCGQSLDRYRHRHDADRLPSSCAK